MYCVVHEFRTIKNPISYMLITSITLMGKRQVKNESALKEIRLPEEGELFGRVLKMMGGENVMIKCADNLTRRGRIRGKLKRRVWIRDNDIVIIAPWDFKEKERGDIVWRFTLPQVQWLKDNNHITRDF
jgi:translation initiation factor 1A